MQTIFDNKHIRGLLNARNYVQSIFNIEDELNYHTDFSKLLAYTGDFLNINEDVLFYGTHLRIDSTLKVKLNLYGRKFNIKTKDTEINFIAPKVIRLKHTFQEIVDQITAYWFPIGYWCSPCEYSGNGFHITTDPQKEFIMIKDGNKDVHIDVKNMIINDIDVDFKLLVITSDHEFRHSYKLVIDFDSSIFSMN